MYRETCIKEIEEYDKFDDYEKKVYQVIKKSTALKSIIKNYSIINFNIEKGMENDCFSFDVAIPFSVALSPVILYSVEGSLLKTNSFKNLVYRVCLPGNDGVTLATGVDKNTKVKENMCLTEITCLYNKFGKEGTKFISITIKRNDAKDVEKLIVDPDSKLYRLYQKKKIDLVTFCNLALLQANQSKDTVLIENNNGTVKLLNKKFRK